MTRFPAGSEEERLLEQILLLIDSVWQNEIRQPDIEAWLDNFDGTALGNPASEHLSALHMLSEFTYFGARELRVLLRTAFLDHVARPLLRDARLSIGGARDYASAQSLFDAELSRTRFLGMGNPADSGPHLLYYFRQENRLKKDLFISPHEIFSGPITDPTTGFREHDVRRFVFLDDLLGSGQQATQYSQTLLQDVREISARRSHPVELVYLVLFAKPEGLATARTVLFDRVCAVHELSDADKAFSPDSRIFRRAPQGVTVQSSSQLATHYGRHVWPSFPLGYRDGQLLLGFHHNIPDNSLPIFWQDDAPGWTPIMPRYAKVYS